MAKLNPFGSTGEADDVKEEVLWAKYGKGREYVHLPLLEVSIAFIPQLMPLALRSGVAAVPPRQPAIELLSICLLQIILLGSVRHHCSPTFPHG